MFRKRVRKWAARAIVMGALPVLVDVASEPYARRGVARSWMHGAAKIGTAVTISWAAGELDGEYSRPGSP